MRPRADEIVQCVVRTYDEYVLPEVTEPYARSLGLTISNLLRLVKLRIEQEGPLLFQDNADLRETLSAVVTYLRTLSAELRSPCELGCCQDEIEAVLARQFRGSDEYPTLASVDEESAALRWALQHAIRALETAADELGATDEYRAIRERIREYLRRSLEREGNLILPAFTSERR